MAVPAYHLRPNKAADRHLLMEAIGRLSGMDNGLRGYTYHGLGGPYLEDFRLLYERHPEIRMVSIEEDAETCKRQEFHRPCSKLALKLVNKSLSDFIAEYDADGGKSIFWLDYTNLNYNHFTDFQSLLRAVAGGSMIKITLRADPRSFWTQGADEPNEQWRKFVDACGNLMPNQAINLPKRQEGLAKLLQEMVKIAAQRGLSAVANNGKFAPVSSFFYSDRTPMFTLTGVVCRGDRKSRADLERRLKCAFGGWEFANLSWKPPTRIHMPTLSTKERLRLQPLLPSMKSGGDLHKELGYRIEGGLGKTEAALEQYATFHRHAPYFLRGVP